MRRSSSEAVRGNFRSDVDRLAPMGGGWWANVIAPLLTAIFAACVIAFGASAVVRLLAPVVEAMR